MHDEWDVIVVGAGTAGIPTAIFAGQRGARVLLVEADDKIGGTLHWSTGQMTAAGTKLQKKLGIDDHPDWHYADCHRISGGTVHPVLGRLAIDNAADSFDWLTDTVWKSCRTRRLPAGDTNLTAFAATPGAKMGDSRCWR